MQINHQCPQCGGSVVLEEADRLLQCAFCRTRLSIQPKDYYRYLFPVPDTVVEEVIFVPYWRFRGMYFACRTSGIKNTVVDKSFPALNSKTLPSTLGIRTQSMNLKFAQRTLNARFVEPRLPFDKTSLEVKNRISYEMITTHSTKFIAVNNGQDFVEIPEAETELREDRLYYDAFVADRVSIVYSPLYIKGDTIYDAILSRPISKSIDIESLSSDTSSDEWIIQFLPTLCPNCGWDLVAERDSCVLLCTHCSSAWTVSRDAFQSVKYVVTSPNNRQQKVGYLPFWKIKAVVSGIDLRSYGDLLRLSNLPQFARKGQDSSDIYFWVPAFKIAPPTFLRIAKQVTVANPDKETHEGLNGLSCYPVNVTLEEAIDSLKVVLAEIAINKKDFIPRLEGITITPGESLLVFHPFNDSGYELTEPEVKCGLLKNAVRWGKNL